VQRDVLAEIEQRREVLVAVGLLAEVVEEGQAVVCTSGKPRTSR
jgi:hypothetical protein